jgi:hypothetical protein
MESEPMAKVKPHIDGGWRLDVNGTLWPVWTFAEDAEENANRINSAVESREKVLRDRIASLESDLSKEKDRVTQLVAEVVDLWGTDTEKLSWIKDRERAAFERAKDLVAECISHRCPECGGQGFTVREVGGCDPDGENDTREAVQQQCQWCDENRNAINSIRFEEGK